MLEPTGGNAGWVSRAQEHVQNWRDEHEDVLNSDAVPIRPERLCQELTDFLPSDAVLLADTGHAGIWTGSMVELHHPGQSYLRAAGSLGWGLPAALGAKCGVPDRPVVCWTGDGGMWYHIGELETAVRYGINAVIVVHNNGGLNQDRRGDEAAYAGRENDNSAELWRFTDTNFAQIAESMGALGHPSHRSQSNQLGAGPGRERQPSGGGGHRKRRRRCGRAAVGAVGSPCGINADDQSQQP